MKVVIFAGGIGSRISEESYLRPKPMIEIGGKPMLWHIMKIFSAQGYNDFIICLGYKGYYIKEYFMNYYLHNSDVTIELKENKLTVHNSNAEDFKVTLVETGISTKTAGRLKRVQQYVGEGDFFLTYGDGVANIELDKLLAFHQSHNKPLTVTAVQPAGRFGVMRMDSKGQVETFNEKLQNDEHWINGGFFVARNSIFDVLPDNADDIMWEEAPIRDMVSAGGLMAYQHHGFWKCMDALRDRIELEDDWNSGNPQWKIW